jgi:hypothetical protein
MLLMKLIYVFVVISTFSIDINECSPGSPCHANATCDNTEGSYTCTCDSGYSGDGLSCDGMSILISNHIILKF